MDITSITYTAPDGKQLRCWDHLMQDGNLRCFSSWGRYTDDCAEIAIRLFMIYVDATGEDTVDLLEGCMSDVVNDADGVGYTLMDNQHVIPDARELLDRDQFRAAVAYAVRGYYEMPYWATRVVDVLR